MPQYFGPRWNTIARLSLFGSPVFLGIAGLAAALFVRSPYWSGRDVPIEQPVPFPHDIHTGRLGIDCRYCHAGSERDAFAGMPATEVCMNCHTYVWSGLSSLAPVRASLETGVPLVWLRVHDLPDHVQFHHGIHTQKGIGCSDCHGRVDEMVQVRKVHTLYMEWCLDCHREPERFLRPRSEVYNMAWQPPPDREEQGSKLMEEHGVKRQTSCSTCHR